MSNNEAKKKEKWWPRAFHSRPSSPGPTVSSPDTPPSSGSLPVPSVNASTISLPIPGSQISATRTPNSASVPKSLRTKFKEGILKPFMSRSPSPSPSAPIPILDTPNTNSSPGLSPTLSTAIVPGIVLVPPVSSDVIHQASDASPPSPPTSGSQNNESFRERMIASTPFKGMKMLAGAVNDLADLEPTSALKAVSSGLLTIIRITENMANNKSDRERLSKELQSVVQKLDAYKNDLSSSSSLHNRMETVQNSLQTKIDTLNSEMEKPWWKKILEADPDAQAIQNLQQFVRDTYQTFTMELGIQTVINAEKGVEMSEEIRSLLEEDKMAKKIIESTIQEIKNATLDALKILENQLLHENLHRSKKAEFNEVTSTSRGVCTEGTRVKILEQLMEWAKNDSSHPIFWMNGMAGTGKTTISYSFCQQLLGEQLLGASFFSSRSEDETTDPARIFPTIAYQIARRSPAFSSALLVSLDKDETSGRTPLESQFRKLILRPAKASASALEQKRLTVVCDGFDECKGLKQISDILSLLITYALELPVKFFISSRPEAEITSKFTNPDHRHQKIVLHNVEDHVVRGDIEVFLHHRFREIQEGRCIDQPWPTDAQFERLLDLSGLLFIYAATVCLFISSPDIPNSMTQDALNAVLSYNAKDSGNEASYMTLDGLYAGILTAACEKSGKEDMQKILCVIVAAQTPLCQTTIAQLLKLPPQSIRVRKTLSSLQSVTSVPDDNLLPVKIFHASFPDFLFDRTRSGPEHHLDAGEAHQFLAEKCLELLSGWLTKDNICGLKDKSKKVSEADIKTHIPEALEYACTNWISHFLQSKDTGTHELLGNQFFKGRLVLSKDAAENRTLGSGRY
ncbi:hypothetical protein VKT23_008091 [Stygiomarasmius scandens]|uniref:Nephrocystin 3-like N-terminal domain-containing protein n=1 Tax=Marasmiellus scandens TaxID=2682957 RepID=A0ABR1JJS5_9AGAR